MKVIKFIQNEDGFTMDSSKYPSYVESVKDILPKGALHFMSADWHYDHRDPRCLHDAKINYMEVKEADKRVSIKISLSGSYGGKIRLDYINVQYYKLKKQKSDWPIGVESHGDLMIDEMLIEDDGFLIHEIIFSDALLKIKHEDFQFSFESVDFDETV